MKIIYALGMAYLGVGVTLGIISLIFDPLDSGWSKRVSFALGMTFFWGLAWFTDDDNWFWL